MKVIEKGHVYELENLDTDKNWGVKNTLTFVMRNNPPEKYPGNLNSHAGCILQEVLRVCIDRAKYVHAQFPHVQTDISIQYMREALYCLELRAATLHGEVEEFKTINFNKKDIELFDACPKCGHIHLTPKDDKWHEEKQKQLPKEGD